MVGSIAVELERHHYTTTANHITNVHAIKHAECCLCSILGPSIFTLLCEDIYLANAENATFCDRLNIDNDECVTSYKF